jgi:hypothetical protein
MANYSLPGSTTLGWYLGVVVLDAVTWACENDYLLFNMPGILWRIVITHKHAHTRYISICERVIVADM